MANEVIILKLACILKVVGLVSILLTLFFMVICNSIHTIQINSWHRRLTCPRFIISIMTRGIGDYEAVIFSGRGNGQLAELCVSTPKCLLQVGENPMVCYPLEWLIQCGFSSVFIIINEETNLDCIFSKFNAKIEIKILCLSEKHESLGTLETLVHFKDNFSRDLILMTCDFRRDDILLYKVVEHHRINPDCKMITVYAKKHKYCDPTPGSKKKCKFVFTPVGIDCSNSVVQIGAKWRYRPGGNVTILTDVEDLHLYVLSLDVLNLQIEGESVSDLITQVQTRAFLQMDESNKVNRVNNLDTFWDASKPSNPYTNALASECAVSRGAKVKGSLLMQGSKVEAGADVINCLIGEYATVQAGSVLKNCFVGPNQIIGGTHSNELFTERLMTF